MYTLASRSPYIGTFSNNEKLYSLCSCDTSIYNFAYECWWVHMNELEITYFQREREGTKEKMVGNNLKTSKWLPWPISEDSGPWSHWVWQLDLYISDFFVAMIICYEVVDSRGVIYRSHFYIGPVDALFRKKLCSHSLLNENGWRD